MSDGGGFWSSVAGGAVGAGGGILGILGSQELENAYAATASKKAWDRFQYAQVMGIPWKVQGLKMAGLNPILAAGGGVGGSVGGLPPPPQTAGGGDFGGAVSKGISSALQLATMKGGAAKVVADAQAAEANARSAGIDADVKEYYAHEMAGMKLAQLQADVHRTLINSDLMNAQIGATTAGTSKTRAQESYTRWQERESRFYQPWADPSGVVKTGPTGWLLDQVRRSLGAYRSSANSGIGGFGRTFDEVLRPYSPEEKARMEGGE